MKVLVALSIFVVLAAAVPITKDEFATLEAFDYDALFADEENRKMVFDCLLDKGDCGPYKQIVELSMKIILSNCAECSPSQKAKYDHVLKVLKEDYASFFNELMQKAASKKEKH
uniref:Putative chemosensory protein CSP7 n=1 Tax=Spodoptera litura TaxID=69820 RepID=A0A0P0DZ19_SPOLT|nr:putative chemosensory protein CSP7 [Spodoptera litura]